MALLCFFYLKLVNNNVLYDLRKSQVWKNLVVLKNLIPTNQIQGFFDHQYLREKSTEILELHGDKHQGKVACYGLII